MVFSTIIFLCIFLPLVILLYYLIGALSKKAYIGLQNFFLLLASLFFYAWGEPKYVFVMLFSIVCNYGFGLWIAKGKNGAEGKGNQLAVVLAVICNLSILAIFKYTGFFQESLLRVVPSVANMAWYARIPVIALPIGISFYTFQGMSYCIDVYRNPELKQKDPIALALYVAMFPQLIAGPIVRYEDIARELKGRVHSAKDFSYGAERFIFGLAKKAILANSMGKLADTIMGADPTTMGMDVAWLGAIAYTLQIYFDFSGYSDMAIGLGRIFGFHFLENFNYPYISKSVREFWRRWHISLSSWFRDYLYIPMGGSRRGNVYFHLLIVFLATGFWHGAAFGFILWGLWHGCFMILERILARIRKDKHKKDRQEKNGRKGAAVSISFVLREIFGRIYTLLVVVFGWVLFKLVSVKDTFLYIKAMCIPKLSAYTDFDLSYYLSKKTLCLLIISVIACLPIFKMKKMEQFMQSENVWIINIRHLLEFILLGICFVFIITGTYNPFIYFRF